MSRHKDTRRHPRFNVELEAVVKTAHGNQLAARTRDLSRSGICLITEASLSVGEPLGVQLVLSFGSNTFSEPLRLDAHVVWCTAITKVYQVGAMFDDLTDEHVEFLDLFLRFLDGSIAPRGLSTADTDPHIGPEEAEEEEGPIPPDVKDDPFRR
jgi:hypothetical protein